MSHPQLLSQIQNYVRNELAHTYRSRFECALDFANGEKCDSQVLDQLHNVIHNTKATDLPGAGELLCSSSISTLLENIPASALNDLFNNETFQSLVTGVLMKYTPELIHHLSIQSLVDTPIVKTFVEQFVIPTGHLPIK